MNPLKNYFVGMPYLTWRNRKSNLLLSLLFVVVCCFYPMVRAEAQTPAPEEMASEPHYRLLLQNEQVRVFEVTLRPTERCFVRHQYNFLVVTLQDSEMVMWNEGESEIANFRFNQGDVHFFYGGPARGMRNDRTNEYHNITVEFLNPKVTTYGYQANIGKWDYGSSGINPSVDSSKKFRTTLNLGQAMVSDVQLLQRDVLPAPDKGISELLIAVTDLDVKVDFDLHVRKSPGDIWWFGDGRKTDLMNNSLDPTRFVLVEFKAAEN